MNIYISGISGTGMGPLAIMAKNAGINVYGSDRSEGAITPELRAATIDFYVGEQDGKYLEDVNKTAPIDWFVYTSALPKDHPELKFAESHGIRTSKRDEFISFLIKKLGLKLVAVAGTHGKTTTTSMLIWTIKELNRRYQDRQKVLSENPKTYAIPQAAYLVGTTLGFAKSGSYHAGDDYFIYEADEYDRNFLHFEPWLAVITYVSYDHPDIYPTVADYEQAFKNFENQSDNLIFGEPGAYKPEGLKLDNKPEVIIAPDARIHLAGEARRRDATTALHAIYRMTSAFTDEEIIAILNDFPGVGRRFERLADGIYTDYAHHPEEIAATIEIAEEEAERTGKKGVVAVYEPHQNSRQHEVRDGYVHAFDGVAKLYWLPTFLTREDPGLAVLKPEDFIAENLNVEVDAEPADTNTELFKNIQKYQKDGYLVILMTAGPADPWLRSMLAKDQK